MRPLERESILRLATGLAAGSIFVWFAPGTWVLLAACSFAALVTLIRANSADRPAAVLTAFASVLFTNIAILSDHAHEGIRDVVTPRQPTAICRDGTYSYSANRQGTCSHHGGVLEWYPHLPDEPVPWWNGF
ncbi:MAG: DUF3761 domain-containing protein [Armatimonadetes bacterium]|nr:DUF3761 domain-containing protein [Armatimonadota bacterium]